MEEKTGFKKKVYRKLDSSPIASDPLSALSSSSSHEIQKKIIPSQASSGLREDFKKTFLPLLIDVFELRQMIENVKTAKDNPVLASNKQKSPKEILKRLEQLQDEIEEAQRWCSGVIMQIAKGIQEAKEALKDVDLNGNDKKKSSNYKFSFGFLKKWFKK